MYMSAISTCISVCQKKAPDLIIDGLWATTIELRELNSGPLEEQSVLLTTEPSLQAKSFYILIYSYI